MFSTRLIFACLFCVSVIAAGAADGARIWAGGGTLHTEGLSGVQLPTSCEILPGPHRDMEGMTARGESPAAVRGTLDTPLDGRGSLMFWFRSDRLYQTGANQKKSRQTLLELPGALTVSFETDGMVVSLAVEWTVGRYRNFRVYALGHHASD